MASATFISFPIGPIVGGYLLDHFWWGSVFLINVPVVALALVAVALLMPESRSEQRPGWTSLGVRPVQRGAGRADLRAASGPARTAGRTRRRWPRSLPGLAVLGRLRGLGAAADPAAAGRRPAADRARAVPVGAASPGARCWPRWSRSRCSASSSRCRSTSRKSAGANALGSGLRLLPMIGGHGRRHDRRAPGWRRRARPPTARPRAAGQRQGLVTTGFAIMAVALAVGRHHHGRQRHRVHGGLVRGVRPGAGAGHAADDERGAVRAVAPSAAARARR